MHVVLKSTLLAAALFAIPACEKSREEMRPDMDRVETQNGLQSRDLREMTSIMAPKLLTIDEITHNPNKITIVVKGVRNKMEGEESRDIDIFVARLAGLLNSQSARDRVAFVEERATVDRFAQQELGNHDPFEEGSRGPQAPSAAITPQYALYGEFHSMHNSKTNYYLCQFKLTNLVTRQIVWSDQYEVSTLNVQ